MIIKPATNFATAAILVFTFFMTSQAQATIKQKGIESLPLEGRYAVSASLGHDLRDYHVRQYSGNLAADNTGQGLSIQFGAEGVTIGSGNQSFSLRPMLWGYEEELVLLPEGMPQAVGNMVTSNRGSVNEWYVNGPMGLQQGFTVSEKPHVGTGPLKIYLALDGAQAGSVDTDGKGVMLTKLDNSPLYRYSGLMVRDARGHEAKAWLEARGGMLQICADDTGLSYPIYIDPIIQVAKLTASDGVAEDNFGDSLAIDNDTIVVGVPYAKIGSNIGQGAAYIFVKPATGWANMTQTAKLIASNGATNDWLGSSVTISGDTIVVGASAADIGSNASQGAAFVFVKPATGWANMTQTAKLIASDGVTGDCFGLSVAIDSGTVVVGAQNNKIGSNTEQGAAYVFVKPATGWANMTQTAKLIASDGAALDNFGSSVTISGDTVVVVAFFDDIGSNTNVGSAYVFVKPATGWANMTQTAKLIASDGVANDWFGFSIAISGDTVVVGPAYVFVKPATGWANMTQTAKLIASDGAVAISGDTIVVGAYVFVKPATGWANMTPTATLIAFDGAAGDLFGSSVAISGGTIVVGAAWADIGSKTHQGSAYVFKIFTTTSTSTTTSVSTTTTTTQPTTTSTQPTTTTTQPTTTTTQPTTTTTQPTTTTTQATTTTTEPTTTTSLETATTSVIATTTSIMPVATTTTTTQPTTTTTVSGRSCPAKKALGKNSPDLENLRDFRDSKLAKSAVGRKAIEIYYNNAESINAALERSPALRAVTHRVLEIIAPMVGVKGRGAQ